MFPEHYLHHRPTPYTVHRNLPNYVIGNDYQHLLKLVREYEHMHHRHSFRTRRMIEAQCNSLYLKVYGRYDYMQPLPPFVALPDGI